MIELTRRYRFAAAHILSNPILSDAENDEIFGKCANPNGHGHDYGVEVTITGDVDPRTGQIAPVEAIDAAFDDAVRRRYSHHLLNDCDAFDALVPTTENFARAVYEDLQPELERRTGARLVRVRLIETPRNFFEYGDPTHE